MSALSGLTPSSTFNGVGFWIVQRGERALPGRDVTALYDRKHIPYGDSAVVQIGGTDQQPLGREVLLKDTDVASFLAQVGVVGTLNVDGVSFGSCLLAGATNVRNWAEGYTMLEAKWER